MRLPDIPFALNTERIFFEASFAYHSDIMLMNGANSKLSGFMLSMELLTAINLTPLTLNVSIAIPT